MRNKAHPFRELTLRIQRHGREKADEAARRVPWQVLLEARNQYLEWQEFYCWARSIMETEEGIPGWLARKLNEMCPGFLDSERRRKPKQGDDALAALRLGEWIDEHIFAFAEKGGWLPAVTFYAVRESRYQKASACWSESVHKWREAKPREYPSFEEWCYEAQRCDETAFLLPAIRKQRECFKLVEPGRLAEAVARYIDWEAFGYWARPALEHKPLVAEVARELDAKCPGFVESDAERAGTVAHPSDNWNRLMRWINEHKFQDAKAEGWFDAILISARMHPRAIRTMECANHCDEVWEGELPVPYPSFENWRRDADRYVDLGIS